MKFATVVVTFVSFCLVSSSSNPAFAAVIDAGDTPASAAVVDVTTLDETSGGPGRHPRRTLVSKKNPTRGVVSNGDACDDIGSNKQACEGAGGFCYWYPHSNTFRDPTIGTCSSSAGVSCGNHRAPNCGECPYYDNNDHGYHYCHGDCKWQSHWYDFGQGVCEPK